MALAALGEGDKAVGLFSLLNPINHARDPVAIRGKPDDICSGPVLQSVAHSRLIP